MNQLTLQEEARRLSHKNDPTTSREVAEKMVKSGKLARQERNVLAAINCCPGSTMESFNFTAKELTEWTFIDISYFVVQRRLSGLREKGKIRRIGEKRNGCMVYELVNAKGGE